MDLNSLLYFLTASILITLAPGPDNMYLLSLSLASGAKKGIFLAGGLASGIAFHTALVICGVAALLQASPAAMNGIKILGSCYLLYIAYHALQEKGDISLQEAPQNTEACLALFRRGILMNILNPKVLLFFLAFLPQFVNATDPHMELHIGLLGLIFSLQAFILFGTLALIAGKIQEKILGIKNLNRYLGILQGVILILIAGGILLS